jgi:hypothetical protein
MVTSAFEELRGYADSKMESVAAWFLCYEGQISHSQWFGSPLKVRETVQVEGKTEASYGDT